MPKVVLWLTLGTAYNRGIVRGVAAYGRGLGTWSMTLLPLSAADPLTLGRALRRLRPDGILAHSSNAALLRAARRVAPLVNAEVPVLGGIATVQPDNAAIGRLAAEHFLDRGFRSLAFLGMAGYGFSRQREEGFRLAAQGAGHEVAGVDLPVRCSDRDLTRQLGPWRRTLGRPLGLLVAYDHLALRVLAACRRLGLRVPEDVAIVGVDNDDIACDLAEVPLSSVDPGASAIGCEAARLLDAAMACRPPARAPMLVPPRRVVVRQSSDVLAVDDPALQMALRHIHAQAWRPLSVAEVVDVATVGRRALEQRFRSLLGRSIRDEIYRAHLARARGLLLETDLPLREVARRSGFRWLEHFCQRFAADCGVTPARFRGRYRVAAAEIEASPVRTGLRELRD